MCLTSVTFYFECLGGGYLVCPAPPEGGPQQIHSPGQAWGQLPRHWARPEDHVTSLNNVKLNTTEFWRLSQNLSLESFHCLGFLPDVIKMPCFETVCLYTLTEVILGRTILLYLRPEQEFDNFVKLLMLKVYHFLWRPQLPTAKLRPPINQQFITGITGAH